MSTKQDHERDPRAFDQDAGVVVPKSRSKKLLFGTGFLTVVMLWVSWFADILSLTDRIPKKATPESEATAILKAYNDAQDEKRKEVDKLNPNPKDAKR